MQRVPDVTPADGPLLCVLTDVLAAPIAMVTGHYATEHKQHHINSSSESFCGISQLNGGSQMWFARTDAAPLVLSQFKARPALTGDATFGCFLTDLSTAVFFIHAAHAFCEEEIRSKSLQHFFLVLHKCIAILEKYSGIDTNLGMWRSVVYPRKFFWLNLQFVFNAIFL